MVEVGLYGFKTSFSTILTKLLKLLSFRQSVYPTFKVMPLTIFLAISATPTNGSTDRLRRAYNLQS